MLLDLDRAAALQAFDSALHRHREAADCLEERIQSILAGVDAGASAVAKRTVAVRAHRRPGSVRQIGGQLEVSAEIYTC